MSKKIVELKSKRKVEIKEMSIDEIDFCSDVAKAVHDSKGTITHYMDLSKSRTAWIRRGVKGGDFKPFKTNSDGFVDDSVIKQLTEEEKNELFSKIQEYQSLGE